MKYRASFHKVWDAHKHGTARFILPDGTDTSINRLGDRLRSGEMSIQDAEKILSPQYDVFQYTTLHILKTGIRFLVEAPEVLNRDSSVGSWSCKLPAPYVCVELRERTREGSRRGIWLFAAEMNTTETLTGDLIAMGVSAPVPDDYIQITVVIETPKGLLVSPVSFLLCWTDSRPAIVMSLNERVDGVMAAPLQDFGNALSPCIETFIRFLNIVNCRGVSRRLVTPNRKSTRPTRKGSGGRYAYHVVDALMKPIQAFGPGTGTRQRYHLRRGHIRTYQTGDAVWINPYFAGDANLGVVVKDYTVGSL